MSVFTGASTVTVANADAQGWSAIQAALQNPSLGLPGVHFDPLCYGGNRQLVVKQLIGNNANGNVAPVFIFELVRNPNVDPPVLQIP